MTWEEESALILRVVALQRTGRLGVVLADRGRFYLCDSALALWQTRRPVTVERLRELVEAAEAATGAVEPQRRPPGREARQWDGWIERRA